MTYCPDTTLFKCVQYLTVYRIKHFCSEWMILSSPNKAVRRNGLKKILEEVKGENFVKDDHLLPFFSKLLYSDEYDTSRELSFQIVSSA